MGDGGGASNSRPDARGTPVHEALPPAMKLTPELIESVPSHLNPLKERQLDLRGPSRPLHLTALTNRSQASLSLPSKISVSPRSVFVLPLPSCTATLTVRVQDQHDCIDFTDNSITVLGNIPLLRRLRTLLLANNRVSSISASLHLSVPNLTTLVLTNNNIAELGDLEPLKDARGLQYLTLLGNPVQERKWYREWLAWRIPSLRVLDFQRIRDKVRYPSVVARTLTCSLSHAGAPDREIAILDSRQLAHTIGDDVIDNSVNALIETRAYYRRTPGSGSTGQGRATHV